MHITGTSIKNYYIRYDVEKTVVSRRETDWLRERERES